MVAEERYPECGGRVDGMLTSWCMRAMPAPPGNGCAGRSPGHSFVFLRRTKDTLERLKFRSV
jgi:hypothetical protein